MRRSLVIACGALARELVSITRQLPNVEVACLPAELHNRPGGIPGAVRGRIADARADGFDHIFVAYADCGTGGLLDRAPRRREGSSGCPARTATSSTRARRPSRRSPRRRSGRST